MSILLPETMSQVLHSRAEGARIEEDRRGVCHSKVGSERTYIADERVEEEEMVEPPKIYIWCEELSGAETIVPQKFLSAGGEVPVVGWVCQVLVAIS
jgi:hypothetical protein